MQTFFKNVLGTIACLAAKGGLFIFSLPTYFPHLNIAQIMCRKLKVEWITPKYYLEKDNLFYAVNRCMASIGGEVKN